MVFDRPPDSWPVARLQELGRQDPISQVRSPDMGAVVRARWLVERRTRPAGRQRRRRRRPAAGASPV